jgi:hypothetical protein
MKPVRRYECLVEASFDERFWVKGSHQSNTLMGPLKSMRVHVLDASLSEHRVLVKTLYLSDPSTARGSAIWRRLNHPHRTMASRLPSVVIDGGTLKRE